MLSLTNDANVELYIESIQSFVNSFSLACWGSGSFNIEIKSRNSEKT